MITLLYRDCLVLATAGRAENVYTVQATIFLSDIRVEDADNGKGTYHQNTGRTFIFIKIIN
jgi:hypothetical protein